MKGRGSVRTVEAKKPLKKPLMRRSKVFHSSHCRLLCCLFALDRQILKGYKRTIFSTCFRNQRNVDNLICDNQLINVLVIVYKAI